MPASLKKQSAPQKTDGRVNLVQGLLGALFGSSLLKFGNPVILNEQVGRPANLAELIWSPWPMGWGVLMFAAIAVLSLRTLRLRPLRPQWLFWAPAAWLGWQLLASAGSVDPASTRLTLVHFFVCAACFYLGACGPESPSRSGYFFLPALAGFTLVLWSGFGQHFGGLEATREMFHQQADWQSYPEEYIKKINSDRIFATLVYPNALAGVVLFWTPWLAYRTWNVTRRFGHVTQGVTAGLLCYAAVACLYWSQSKAGWLIAMAMGFVCLMELPFRRRWKIAAAGILLAGGLIFFFARYADYFNQGATSVAARFDYWSAALKNTKDHPVLGSGPGTFKVPYARLKRPESEMARLTHNDYLEQASDSGIPGALFYLAIFPAGLAWLYKANRKTTSGHLLWLGLFAWTLQGCVEFGLYIPALGWPAFYLYGSLWPRREETG